MANALKLVARTEEEMSAIAGRIAPHLKPGRPLLLTGPIGAGKTHLARGIVRALLGYEEDVPSPTYTIVQAYSARDFDIWHADLYRVKDSLEIIELGLEEALEEAVVVIEWPDRLPTELIPDGSIHVDIAPVGDDRELRIAGRDVSHWQQVLA